MTEKELYKMWQLCARLAGWLGMEVGAASEPDTSIVLIIGLPSGDIWKEIPIEYVEGSWKVLDRTPLTSENDFYEMIEICLNGYLVSRHVLIKPEKEEKEDA